MSRRFPHPIAHAIVRRHDAPDDEPLTSLPYSQWWRVPRLDISAVAIVIDSGLGTTEDEIRAAMSMTVLDPSYRTATEQRLEMLIMQERMIAEDRFDADDRAVAERIRDLPEVEPAEGWEERAFERWRRERTVFVLLDSTLARDLIRAFAAAGHRLTSTTDQPVTGIRFRVALDRREADRIAGTVRAGLIFEGP